jgi:hypothetical protein
MNRSGASKRVAPEVAELLRKSPSKKAGRLPQVIRLNVGGIAEP